MSLPTQLSAMYRAEHAKRHRSRKTKRAHSKKHTSPKADEGRETRYVFRKGR